MLLSLLLLSLFQLTGLKASTNKQLLSQTLSATHVSRALLRLISVACLQLHTSSARLALRSASDTLSPQIPRDRLSAIGSRAFPAFGPSAWNDLRRPLRKKS